MPATQAQIEAILRQGWIGDPRIDMARMARVVWLRTSGDKPVPYRAIGEEFGLSRERVRVLYARALWLLRRTHRRHLVLEIMTHGDGLSREVFGCYEGDGCRA